MRNSTSHSFAICDELTLRLRALRFDSDAEPQPCILPLASIFWPDEWPDGRPRIKCHEECEHSFLRLVAARAEFWRSEQIPAEFQTLWDQAKKVIPDWPGFERMYITEDQQRAIAECEGGVLEFFQAMSDEMGNVTVGEKDGFVTFSATLDLQKEPPKKPWWKFWRERNADSHLPHQGQRRPPLPLFL